MFVALFRNHSIVARQLLRLVHMRWILKKGSKKLVVRNNVLSAY